MANSERSKLKTLLIYDYFLKNVSEYNLSSAVTLEQIVRYVSEVTGEEFERKSIYADIRKINDFVRCAGLYSGNDDWIYKYGSKYYLRHELDSEIGLDEARLIVDAINTTPFVSTGLCKKIKKMYPCYFSKGYHSLYPRDEAGSSKTKFLLNTIRTSIEEKSAISFDYGYRFARGIRGASVKTVSPLVLDWQDNKYYLIAVDNDEYEKGAKKGDMAACLRRYRIDRIDGNARFAQKRAYIDPGRDCDRMLKDYISHSVKAYSSEEMRSVRIRLHGDNEKNLLRAFSAFTDVVSLKYIITDNTEKGSIEFEVESGMAPTVYTELFRLYTFDGVDVEILDEEVRSRFRAYLNKALYAQG